MKIEITEAALTVRRLERIRTAMRRGYMTRRCDYEEESDRHSPGAPPCYAIVLCTFAQEEEWPEDELPCPSCRGMIAAEETRAPLAAARRRLRCLLDAELRKRAS